MEGHPQAMKIIIKVFVLKIRSIVHRNAAPNLPTRPLSSMDVFFNFTVALLCNGSKK
jgi:hypothetical protein